MNNQHTVKALGLMSGTSGDGIDVAVIETDGDGKICYGPALTISYAPETAVRLHDALKRQEVSPGLEEELTEAHYEAVMLFYERYPQTKADVIGFHGQTICHYPRAGNSVNIGDGAMLARRLNTPVVYKMREADMAGGGLGAPLAPVVHKVLAAQHGCPYPCAIVNIGGVCNITYIGKDGNMRAGDIGPGCALLDDLIKMHELGDYDAHGKIAQSGQVHESLLAKWLDHPYFHKPLPKAADRNDFHEFLRDAAGLSVFDAAATLAALTSTTLIRSADLLPENPEVWLLAGGGSHNRAITDNLSRHLNLQYLQNADYIEAQLMAYLATRSIRNLPYTFTTTTGVCRPTSGGILCQP